MNPTKLTETCKATVTAVTTPPRNVPPYTDPTHNPGVFDTYIRVDPVTGQISYTSDQSVPPTAGGAAMLCGPSAANVFGGQVTVDPITLQFTPAVSEPLIQTYVIQCIDANGVASNAVTLPVSSLCKTMSGCIFSSSIVYNSLFVRRLPFHPATFPLTSALNTSRCGCGRKSIWTHFNCR